MISCCTTKVRCVIVSLKEKELSRKVMRDQCVEYKSASSAFFLAMLAHI